MRHGAAMLLALLSACAALASSPAEAVAAALADAQKLPAETRPHYRYMSLYNIPLAERDAFERALVFHFHCLSREPEIVPLYRVAPGLVRVYFPDYGWERGTWEKLAPFEVYFHFVDQRVVRKIRLNVPVAVVPVVPVVVKPAGKVLVEREGFLREIDRADVRSGETVYVRREGNRIEVEKVEPTPPVRGPVEAQTDSRLEPLKPEGAVGKILHAPWLGDKQIAELATLLNSDVPIVRADWFLFFSGIAKNRGGAGYYDFLGLKSRKDAEKLAGLDVEAARKLRLEMAALVDDSGVALNNRQILWFKTLAGSWWITLDADASVGEKNALRLYDGDFTHNAEEIYFTLPSGVWGLVASDDKGKLQDTVPDTIASDSQSASNDKRIHCGMSCIRCHVEGIRNIDDWARATFTGPVALASRDPAKLKRLQRLYLSDLPDRIKEDNRAYARVLWRINRSTPQENARDYASAWTGYADARLDFEALCRELACEPKDFRKALEIYAAQGDADLHLSSLLSRKPRPIRREHWEELFGLAQSVLRGGKP